MNILNKLLQVQLFFFASHKTQYCWFQPSVRSRGGHSHML